MANEVEWTYASQVTLEDNGAESVSDTYIAANDAALASANHSNYPLADFVLKCQFSSAAVALAGAVVRLYRQDLNIDSTNDPPAPSAAYQHLFVGSFVIPSNFASDTDGYFPLTDVPLAKDQQFSIENKTAQTIAAGWDLKATPKTFNPGA